MRRNEDTNGTFARSATNSLKSAVEELKQEILDALNQLTQEHPGNVNVRAIEDLLNKVDEEISQRTS